MSLKLDYMLMNKMMAKKAIVKVHRLTIVNAEEVKINYKVYLNEEEKDKGNSLELTPPLRLTGTDYSGYFSEETFKKVKKTPIQQAYIYLKTLDIFKNATDI